MHLYAITVRAPARQCALPYGEDGRCLHANPTTAAATTVAATDATTAAAATATAANRQPPPTPTPTTVEPWKWVGGLVGWRVGEVGGLGEWVRWVGWVPGPTP